MRGAPLAIRNWLALALLCVALDGLAATFGLTPMRVALSSASPTGIVTVNNSGDAPLTVQVQPLAWSQPGGKDLYEETRAFIVSPPIFTIPPGGAQIVRVALRGQPAANVEQSYRLVFREVPAAEEASTDRALFHIALNMDIPMFVAPATGTAAPVADFGFDAGAGGPPRLRIGNKGNANLRLADLAILQGQEKLGGEEIFVVLPGATRYVALAAGPFRPGVPLRVDAQSNAGRIDVAVPVGSP